MIDQKTLPKPTDLVAYSGGSCGPVMFHHLDEGTTIMDARAIAWGNGYALRVVEFADDPAMGWDDEADMPELARLQMEGENVVDRWEPPSPGDGWIFAGKHDGEEGPIALFLRPLTEEEREREGWLGWRKTIENIAEGLETTGLVSQCNNGMGIGPEVLYEAAKDLRALAARMRG